MGNMRDSSQWLRQPVTGMAHPEVTDGGDGVQICRVTMQYRVSSRGEPARGYPRAWGVGQWASHSPEKCKVLTNGRII